ncbi:MAG: hypothetical protein FWH27_14395, partial [Planctomycetaceae bacterium]|nr:hypothetical protein [Planctomycetaceae bacterium]
ILTLDEILTHVDGFIEIPPNCGVTKKLRFVVNLKHGKRLRLTMNPNKPATILHFYFILFLK